MFVVVEVMFTMMILIKMTLMVITACHLQDTKSTE